MPAISTADQNTLGMFPHSTRLGMAVFRAASILTGQVSGGSTGDTSLTLTGISETRTPNKHYTVIAGSSAGANDGGKTRMKTWSSPTLTVAANNIDWATYPHVSVLEEILPWAIIPDLSNDYEDGDVAYTNENTNYHPLARIGPPAIGWTSQAVNFRSDSAAVASGASISSHAWTFPSGSPASSSSAGSAGSPIAVTWSAATGHTPHYVEYTVTDSNGKTHTRYCPTWIFSSFEDSYCDWELESLSGDYDSGGWQARIRVFGDATTTEFPEDAMVVIFAEDRYGGHKTSIGGNWTHRENIIFVGWIARDTVLKDAEKGDVSFELVGPALKMKELNCWPANLKYDGSPSTWHELKGMTCDLAAFHIITEHTTMDHICDLVLSGNTKVLRFVDIPENDPYTQVDEYCSKPIGARLLSDRQGRLYISRNPNLRPESERTSIANVISLDINGDIRADPGLELAIEEHEYQVAQVDFVAFGYDGSDATPYYSLAPQYQYETGGVKKIDGRRADSQTEANTLAGLYLANENNIWREVRVPMFNHRIFDIVPEEYMLLTLAASDTRRGVTWTNQKLICRMVEIEFDRDLGALHVTPAFEKDSSGPSGVTNSYPSAPPTASDPGAPSWPPDNPDVSVEGPIVVFDNPNGCHVLINSSWQTRNTGLSSAQKQMLCGITDPYWKVRNGGDPEACIFLAGHAGGMIRSINSGKTWTDITPKTNPPNDWTDDPAPTATDLNYVALHGDIHNKATFYALANWQNGDSEWRGWIVKSDDDGENWAWTSLISSETISFTFDSDAEGWSFVVLAGADPCDFNWVSGDTYGGTIELFIDVTDPPTNIGGSVFSPGINFLVQSGSQLSYKHKLTGDDSTHSMSVGFSDGSSTVAYSSPNHHPQAWHTHTYNFLSGDFGKIITEIAWIDHNTKVVDTSSRVDDVTLSNGNITELRPLGIEIDTEDGSRVYVTMWDGTNLSLWVYNSSLTLQRITSLGAASAAQVNAKTYYALPFTPHLPGVSNFGNYIFVWGRMAGSIAHIAKSTDAGDSFSDVGNAAWSSERVTAFGASQYGSPDELRAFLDTPEFWHAMGANWQKIADLNFAAEAASRGPEAGNHPYCIGSNAAGAQMINYGEDPYSTWSDITAGYPKTGVVNSIIWIV